MSQTWTTEQILALAPDASSAKSGRDLANPRKWVTMGANDAVLWGECQGSGKLPYQTVIDLAGPAYKCSCPSRKFPCKHGLGLFLMLPGQPAAFTQTEPPAWAADWVASRTQKAEQRVRQAEKRAEGGEEAVSDAAAQAKRAQERERRVAAGLAELELWLRDLLRRGLADAPSQPYSFWEGPAARMVDAQAPGIARLLREAAGIPNSGDGWPERLLERLGRLHLLIEGFRRLEALPPETQADVRAAIGWTVKEDEVIAAPPVRDRWQVLGQRIDQEERLRVQRTWLRGHESGRAAVVLNFAHGTSPLEPVAVPGTTVAADLAFFPGAYPLRALLRERHAVPEPLHHPHGFPTVDAALGGYAAALAAHPWLDLFPVCLAAVTPVRDGAAWWLRDAESAALPLSPKSTAGWQLLALSGGASLPVFGEWDGRHLLPLGVWTSGRYLRLDARRGDT